MHCNLLALYMLVSVQVFKKGTSYVSRVSFVFVISGLIISIEVC